MWQIKGWQWKYETTSILTGFKFSLLSINAYILLMENNIYAIPYHMYATHTCVELLIHTVLCFTFKSFSHITFDLCSKWLKML